MIPTWGPLAACALGGYLLGSIPFGLIATRLGGAGDIRAVGSGNIGATNVLRTGRRDLALITLVGDFAKGAGAVLIAGALVSPLGGVVAGGAAFLGHLFSVWLKFRGGKGVATFFGVIFAASLPAGLAAAVVWLAVAAIYRLASLASLCCVVASMLTLRLLDVHPTPVFWLTGGMAILVFVRHGANIRRLLAGTEPRIGGAKSPTA